VNPVPTSVATSATVSVPRNWLHPSDVRAAAQTARAISGTWVPMNATTMEVQEPKSGETAVEPKGFHAGPRTAWRRHAARILKIDEIEPTGHARKSEQLFWFRTFRAPQGESSRSTGGCAAQSSGSQRRDRRRPSCGRAGLPRASPPGAFGLPRVGSAPEPNHKGRGSGPSRRRCREETALEQSRALAGGWRKGGRGAPAPPRVPAGSARRRGTSGRPA
jgi:hypothetical protein